MCMWKLPRAGEKPTQRIRGSSTGNSHRAGNSACSSPGAARLEKDRLEKDRIRGAPGIVCRRTLPQW